LVDLKNSNSGDWVGFGCLDYGARLFHSEDVGMKEQMLAAGSVCEVAGEEGEFWIFRFGSLRVRLRKEFVGGAVIPRPPFVWNELVRVKPPRSLRVGKIVSIGWHAKQRCHLFRIEENGKRIKSRYFAYELEDAHSEQSTTTEQPRD
jgi:hypothetical protein